MKFFKLKRLNMIGASHLVALMLVVVGAGAIGTYELVASHADTSRETCSTISGSTSSRCSLWETARVYVNGTTSYKTVSKQSFVATCQEQSSVVYTNGSYKNNWWAYSGSGGLGGWVNATYASGGVNNTAPFVPGGSNPGSFDNTHLCTTLHVAVTVPRLSSPTGSPVPPPVTCATPGQTVTIPGGTKCNFDGSVHCNAGYSAHYVGSSLGCVTVCTNGSAPAVISNGVKCSDGSVHCNAGYTAAYVGSSLGCETPQAACQNSGKYWEDNGCYVHKDGTYCDYSSGGYIYEGTWTADKCANITKRVPAS